jgi:catechol 2,3-dioxygenase-like lactoylglutathione lyase family enzyme
MPPVTSTRDILIQTEQPDEARAFYAGILGFAVFADDPAMCGLETGSFRLFIDPAPALGPVLEFAADDLAVMKARLLAAGCRVIEENAAIPRCYLRDPFGLIFNLRQRA